MFGLGAIGGVLLAGGLGLLDKTPDLIVSDLQETAFWDSQGGISAYSVGTTACNVGKASAAWFRETPDHPVITQNLFRYKDGRFEQIGMSWAKHSFCADDQPGCGKRECKPDALCEWLTPACSDAYTANFNGLQFLLGPRSEINPSTGEFPYPFNAVPPTTNLSRRLQVRDLDLNPQDNEGAIYFIEGQYVARDDALAGNGLNNSSYREITIQGEFAPFQLEIVEKKITHQEKPAIFAWREMKHTAKIIPMDVPGDGRIYLGYLTTDLGNGLWEYEYAIQNYNSHRAIGAFRVPLADDPSVAAIGFHDVDSHSGDGEGGGIYSTVDWPGVEGADSIAWSAESYEQNLNANALRWGTLYNFRFQADAPPGKGMVEMTLFRPGTPTRITLKASVPGSALLAPPCESVKRFTAKCKEGGAVQAKLSLGETPPAGYTAIVDIDGQVIQKKIKKTKTKFNSCCHSGTINVTLSLPDGCTDPLTIECP